MHDPQPDQMTATIPPPQAAPPDPVGRRRGTAFLGVALIVVGLVLAVVLWFAGVQRRDDAIEGLARAPVGCDTTLDFADAGDYYVFVETKGTVEPVSGDCGVAGAYDLDAEPTVSVSAIDADGEPVEVQAVDGPTYDAAGHRGRGAFVVSIEVAGDHVMRVESTDDVTFAVAVGRNPNDGVALLRVLGVSFALAGVTGGVLLLVLGRRRTTPQPPATTAGWPPQPAAPNPWSPVSSPPQAPPVGPPIAGPGPQVPYSPAPPPPPGARPPGQTPPPPPPPRIPGQPAWGRPVPQPPPPAAPPGWERPPAPEPGSDGVEPPQ